MGTTLNKIRLLKLHFEESVNGELFLWTNIQKAADDDINEMPFTTLLSAQIAEC